MIETNNLELVVVDDDDLTLVVITRLLKSEDCTVIGYTNPEEGLAHLLNSSPDFLFVDWRMPRIDGFTFLKMLHDQGSVGDTKIYLNSAAYPTDTQQNWLSTQDVGFARKAEICNKSWLRSTLGFDTAEQYNN